MRIVDLIFRHHLAVPVRIEAIDHHPLVTREKPDTPGQCDAGFGYVDTLTNLLDATSYLTEQLSVAGVVETRLQLNED